MKIICLVICLFFGSYSQDHINVYRFSFDTEIDVFEQNMLENILELYNNKNKTNTTFIYNEVKSFKELFTILDKPENKNNSFSISSITITKDRKKKYDFSPRYMPIRYAIIALKSRNIKNWKNSKYRFGYIKGTTDETFVRKFRKDLKIKVTGFNTASSKLEGLNTGKIDIMLSEIISNFKNDNFSVLENIILDEDGYGMAFPKDSTLLPKLKSFVSYYTKSKKYYNLLRTAYGKDVAKILHQAISKDR